MEGCCLRITLEGVTPETLGCKAGKRAGGGWTQLNAAVQRLQHMRKSHLQTLSWRPLQRTNVKTGWQVTRGGQCEYIITAWEHLPFAICMKCIVANWATLAFAEFTGSSFM
ncbi:unnamed protein product [Tetraodon nigroviridis]|uniref:(spotted green pufferfish) hypothetical protein n=1 Tax=Tetraodon nigroviridis TaxID=99883 RepID=Q4S7Q3_TETNG|nr:unnamed protein product [Tetraodon nigroviridis]